MKSVIVQGATVAKAIDEALQKAGMPQEFFIKILEEAQPGFLGFGSKKAKIALFFKKEDKRKDKSLISSGMYKDLFNNQGLQVQIDERDPVEHKVTTESLPQQPKQSQQPRQQHRPQQRNPEQRGEVKPRPVEQDKSQVPRSVAKDHKQIEQNKQHTQAPVKGVNNSASDVKQPQQKKVVMHQRQIVRQPKPVQEIKEQVSQEPVKIDDQAQSQHRRPRRRRTYGYRSRGQIQWGKSQDEESGQDVKSNSNQNTNNEPKDSESK